MQPEFESRSTRRAGVVGVLLVGLAACAANPASDSLAGSAAGPVATSAVERSEGGPWLGAEFGQLVTIDAEVRVVRPGKGPVAQVLRIARVDGRAVDEFEIEWTYGGHLAERAAAAGVGGSVIEPGRRYRLRGYETGGWAGSPPAARLIPVDEFGPPQVRNFGFRRVFRVLDGEVVGSPSAGSSGAPPRD